VVVKLLLFAAFSCFGDGGRQIQQLVAALSDKVGHDLSRVLELRG
jgi:hypothetical protein